MSDEARRQRALERRNRIIIRRAPHGSNVDVVPLSGAPAVALAAQLSRQAWTLAGRELPALHRSQLPYRFVPMSRRQ